MDEQTGYKMYFNTGVKPYNHLDKSGKLIESAYHVIKDGTIQIEYWLERKPDDRYTFRFLCPEAYLSQLNVNEVAIKIIGGGMLSDYAIFLDCAKFMQGKVQGVYND